MPRASVRMLIVVPWALLTLATLFLFMSHAEIVTRQLMAVAVLALAISIPSAIVVANTVTRAIHELRIEAVRLARLRSSPVDPQSLEEFHLLRTAITSTTDELHSRVDTADLETRRFRAVLESLTEGVIQLSADCRFVHANAAARTLLSLPDKVEGQSTAALIRHRELRDILQEAVVGHSMRGSEITVDDRHLLISPRRVQLPGHGDIPGAIVTIIDLTQLRRLEGVRRDFVANVSHELKTPLTSIRGYTETLLGEPEMNASQRQQFLAVIHSNAERLHKIIDDLLDISRLQSGGWQPELTAIDVINVIEDVVAAIDVARRSQLQIEIESARPARVMADARGLRQALTNILENAIHHTRPGGYVGINVHAAPPSTNAAYPMMEIEIRDTGSGISREALPRIFERFYRADAGRRRGDGGTGLGLSIVKHFVERMGGTVDAESELGKGTTIRILLPAAEV